MTRRVTLDPALEEFVDELVRSGRFTSDGEVVSAGLQLLQEEERFDPEQIEVLREAWKKGIASGNYRPADEVFDRLIAKYQDMVKAGDR